MRMQRFIMCALCGPARQEAQFATGVGAADKAAIQLVEVQPYQLLVSDT
jgi:hypothetical protein